jgi:hypothetical protein
MSPIPAEYPTPNLSFICSSAYFFTIPTLLKFLMALSSFLYGYGDTT